MTALGRHRMILLIWMLALTTGIVGFVRLGTPGADPPPLDGFAAVERWWGASDPLDAVVALVRPVLIVLLAYLLVVTSLQLLGTRRGWARLRCVSGHLVPRFLVILTAGVVASSGPAFATSLPGHAAASPGARDTSGEAPTMQVAEPSTASASSSRARTSLPWASDVQMTVDAAGDAAEATGSGTGATGATGNAAASTADTPLATSYVVQSGDHLWSIAERVMTNRLAAPPSDAQIVAYWSVLIAMNRDRLVDPDDPDLILPGQEFALPPG